MVKEIATSFTSTIEGCPMTYQLHSPWNELRPPWKGRQPNPGSGLTMVIDGHGSCNHRALAVTHR